MTDTAEESFPRGGVPKVTTKKGEKRIKNDEIDLFKISSTEPSEKKKTKKDRRKLIPTNDAAESVVVISIEKFSPAIVTDDMLLLGRVSEIADYHMIVSLPEGVTGKVSITDISDAYTDLLKKMANEDSEGEEFKPLDELFTIGQLICCRVKEITSKGPKQKKDFSFTVNPKSINRDLDIGKIDSQTVVTGSISSQEDHGYTLDIGLPGLNAFVSNAEAAKYKHPKPLPVGLLVQCSFTKGAIETVKSRSGRVVQVKLKSDTKKSIESSKDASLNNLLPGTIVSAEVVTSNPRGIRVGYLDKFQGAVHCHQLTSDPLKFKPKQEVKLCILYHQPLLGVSYLSMLPHLLDPSSDESRHYELIRDGDTIDSASVIRIEPKSGALLRLKNNIRGYLPLKFVHDNPSKKTFDDFPKTSIKCRVKKFDMMNNYAIVSCCKSFLDRTILKLEDFIPGQLVEAVVKRFHSGHILVRVGGCYRGFIPDVHNANVPLKHPEKKYAVDATIRCRVLKLEGSNRQSVTLTAKESLVKTKLPMINSMDVLEKDMITEGVVVKIYPTGLLIGFYNDLSGFVGKSEAVDDVNKLQESFYIGQVVKCRVRSWDLDSDKIRLSLRLDPGKIDKVESKDPSRLDANRVYSCQVKRIADKGLTVIVDGVRGFLPVNHLSDNMVNCKHLVRLFKIDQEIDRVVLFEHGATPIFTMKQSILRAVAEKPLVDDIADLIVGMTVPGVVRNTVDWGVFVQLSHSLKGVAHNRYILDGHQARNDETLFKTGQSVDVHILETDVDRNRISCSLRVSDCYQGDTGPALDLLTSYLNERSRIVGYYAKNGNETVQKLTQFAVGSIIEVTIEQTNEYGSVGYEVNTHSKAICTVFHMEGCTVKVGETRKAVVLYQDFESKCLEVTMSKKIVSAITNRSEGPSNHLNEGSTQDALVLLVKPEFVLLALRGRPEYKIAYAPAQKCINDVTGSAFFEPGFSDKVEVKKVRDFVVCSWQAYEVKRSDGKTGKLRQSHNLSIGSEVIAVVKDILPFQMNIRIGAIPGRIFASEVDTDSFKSGDRLSKNFQTGQELKAVVIGFREAKSLKLMEFLGKKARGLPECSVRQGRLDGTDNDREYNVGDVVPGFYYDVQKRSIMFRLSSTMNGRCDFLHSDFPTNVLNNPDRLQSGAYYPLTVVKRYQNVCDVAMVKSDCVRVGEIVVCQVRRIRKDSIIVRLPWKKRGTVSLTEITDHYTYLPTRQFKVGQFARGQILAEKDNGFQVSLRKSRAMPMPLAKQPTDKVIESTDELMVNEIVRGFVTHHTDRTVTILLGSGVFGVATGDFISDVKDSQPTFRKYAVVYAKILKIGSPVLVSLKESDTGFKELTIARKRRNSDRTSVGDEEGPPSKRKLSDSVPTGRGRKRTESGSEIVVCPALATRKRQLSDASDTKEDAPVVVAKLPRLDVDSEATEQAEARVKSKTVAKKAKTKKKKTKALTQVKKDDPSVVHLDVNEGFAWVNDFTLPSQTKNESESSDDEEEPSVVKEDKKSEEKRLIELENRLLDSNRVPETEDEFDRLVVQSPDSSMIWLQYMAHHLKMAEIDKARTIAERALKSISFREEQEKSNVWAALMNLENSYGTPDQLKEVFDRAVQMNDSFKVHNQLVKIYESSDKHEQAERLYSSMVRQFGMRKQVWIDFATFYFGQNRYDSARKMVERGLKTMDKRDHMEVVTKFGRLEFEHGQNDQAIDLFERVLAECPKRLDVWNVYIDLLVKHATIEKVRRVFLKVVGIQLPAKKMKSVYKKWLDFETKHGDQSSVEEVKEKAAKYAQSNKIE